MNLTWTENLSRRMLRLAGVIALVCFGGTLLLANQFSVVISDGLGCLHQDNQTPAGPFDATLACGNSASGSSASGVFETGHDAMSQVLTANGRFGGYLETFVDETLTISGPPNTMVAIGAVEEGPLGGGWTWSNGGGTTTMTADLIWTVNGNLGKYEYSFPITPGSGNQSVQSAVYTPLPPALVAIDSTGSGSFVYTAEMSQGLSNAAFNGSLTGTLSDPIAFTVTDPGTGEPVGGVTVTASDGYRFAVNATPEPGGVTYLVAAAIVLLGWKARGGRLKSERLSGR